MRPVSVAGIRAESSIPRDLDDSTIHSHPNANLGFSTQVPPSWGFAGMMGN
jgi:hypothetical protein